MNISAPIRKAGRIRKNNKTHRNTANKKKNPRQFVDHAARISRYPHCCGKSIWRASDDPSEYASASEDCLLLSAFDIHLDQSHRLRYVVVDRNNRNRDCPRIRQLVHRIGRLVFSHIHDTIPVSGAFLPQFDIRVFSEILLICSISWGTIS
jgi:hypothetical protein